MHRIHRTAICVFALLLTLIDVEAVKATELARRLAGNATKLVFEEDFVTDASLQRFVFAAPTHWRRVAVGNRFALEHTDAGNDYQPPFRSPLNIALIAGIQLNSFVLEYEAQQSGEEYGHRDACVFFNFVDPTHYYYTHIATKSDPHAHQVFIVNEAPRVMITQQGTTGFDWKSVDDWHSIRVVRDADSGEIEIYVDQMDRPILQAKDQTFTWGYVGFGSFDDTGRVTHIRLYADLKRDAPTPYFLPRQ